MDELICKSAVAAVKTLRRGAVLPLEPLEKRIAAVNHKSTRCRSCALSARVA
jgi:hypothetical protein